MNYEALNQVANKWRTKAQQHRDANLSVIDHPEAAPESYDDPYAEMKKLRIRIRDLEDQLTSANLITAIIYERCADDIKSFTNLFQ